MLDAIRMRMALLSSALRLSRRRRSRGSGLRLLLLLHSLSSASDTWGSDIVRPRINGKVLQGIAVDDALGRVLLGQSQHGVVVISVVVYDVLAHGRDVQDAVQQVDSPDGVEGGSGDGVAQVADRVERAADFKRARADDGLLGGILAAPVSSPVLHVRVS